VPERCRKDAQMMAVLTATDAIDEAISFPYCRQMQQRNIFIVVFKENHTLFKNRL
jgi:hypothetical protein